MSEPPPDDAAQRRALRQRAQFSLRLPMEQLEAECDVGFFIASGPGGQHRNKTESGVRLLHRPTGLEIRATERRSQAQNRSVALERLREALAELTFVEKPRVATRPSRGAKRRRLADKKHQSDKKKNRGDDW